MGSADAEDEVVVPGKEGPWVEGLRGWGFRALGFGVVVPCFAQPT